MGILSSIGGAFRSSMRRPNGGSSLCRRSRRSLVFKDFVVLWGDLGIGLLVMLAGTFLVPGLGLGAALTAILVGTALGCLLLALIGVVGATRAGRPWCSYGRFSARAAPFSPPP